MVSSSLIRAMLRLGKVTEAGPLLGRSYGVAGRVVQGKGRGAKLLGVPTANILTPNELLPASGIYAVWVRRGEVILPGVANIGTCPTFNNTEFPWRCISWNSPAICTGRSCRWSLSSGSGRRRRVFPSIEELAAQIRADMAAARTLLAKEKEFPRKS